MTERAERDKKAIAQHYAELGKFAHNENYERAIKIANKILNLSPKEFEAFYYKIVCLIQLERFEEAISFLNKNPQNANSLNFEKAYCFYRVNKHKEALKIVDEIQELDYRLKELKAQILYRLENYEDSADLYKEIIKNTDDNNEDERHTNLSAVLSQFQEAEMLNSLESLRENTYELCFNKACILINLTMYNEAEKKLKQCEKLCREMLEEEEASEEEIDVDLALIRIQLAFVYQKQGRIKEAQQLYTQNLKIKLDDIALTAVASNNIVCINKDQNLFDSKKKMKTALNDSLNFKLPSKQRKFIALNNAILNYYLHQTQQCEQICGNIEKQWPELAVFTVVLKALNLVKVDKVKSAIELLETFKIADCNKTEDDLFVKLCIAQLYLVQGNRLEACKVMENLGDNSYKPGIVGALTTLYLGMGDEESALKVFEKSVNWYKKNRVDMDLTLMWRQAADFHIRNGHPQVAANSLEELLRTNQNDKKIVAQLVLACSQFDKERAINLSKQLPSIEELSENLDINSLQMSSTSLVNLKKSPGNKQDTQPGTPKTDPVKKRKHKKRKGKLPKNYVEGATPDPERWLPKYERSGFRKKRDRRTKEVIKGSQGTASGQAEQYDFSSKIAEETDSPNTVEPSPRARGQQRKGQGKKKNKRR